MKGSVYALPLISCDTATLKCGVFNEFRREKVASLVKVRITNQSNIPITLSLDGETEHDFIAPFATNDICFPADNKGIYRSNSYFIKIDQPGKGMCYIATYCLHMGV